MEDIDRPFDMLEDLKNKTVLVFRNTKPPIRGKLKAFDKHVNVVLEDSVVNNADHREEFGELFIKGKSVKAINPVEEA